MTERANMHTKKRGQLWLTAFGCTIYPSHGLSLAVSMRGRSRGSP